MRKRISESNESPNFDLFDDYEEIENLLSERNCIGRNVHIYGRRAPLMTIEQHIDAFCFSNWRLRGKATLISKMRKNLCIEKAKITRETINEELVLNFLQFSVNCIYRVLETIDKQPSLYAEETFIQMLKENIENLIERLNCSIQQDETTSEFFIQYKDDISTVVAMDNKDIAESITEYKRIDNKENLTRKGEILCTLYKKLEFITPVLKGAGYKNLLSDTTYLFNKTGVRHCIEKGKQAHEAFSKMQDDELEKWYDRTYDLFLSCMVIVKYLDVKPEIDSSKQTTGE